MKKFTRSIIATACLVTSFGAFAHEGHSYKGDYKGEAMPLMPVTIPVLQGGLDFTLGALWLKPTSSNVEYVSTTFSPAAVGVTSTVTNDSESVNPQYTWGFLLGMGYIFPNTANDVRLNWMHLHDDGDEDSSSFSGPNLELFPVDSDITSTLGDGDTASAEGEVVYDFDAVDLTFGQYINIGPRLQTRLFTGLRWARLKNELSGNYSFPVSQQIADNSTLSSESDSSFNGIGPLFGIEANYMVGYGVGISGYLDAALLVGKVSLDQSLDQTFFAGAVLDSIVNTDFDHDSQSVVAPAWDARLGVNYTYFMGNGSAFRFEIGYQVSKYVDVIQTSDFAETPGSETINFGLNGLYLQGTFKV